VIAAEIRYARADDRVRIAYQAFGVGAYVSLVDEAARASLSPRAVRPLFEVSLELDVRNVLPAIAVPTLVMQREHDSAQPVELMREAAGLIPGLQHVELSGVDPWVAAEAHEPMFDAIGSFIETLGGASAP
jgi:pimeloyl-ACP methyl ester carboxylesterase